jgi:hypothetical protein
MLPQFIVRLVVQVERVRRGVELLIVKKLHLVLGN